MVGKHSVLGRRYSRREELVDRSHWWGAWGTVERKGLNTLISKLSILSDGSENILWRTCSTSACLLASIGASIRPTTAWCWCWPLNINTYSSTDVRSLHSAWWNKNKQGMFSSFEFLKAKYIMYIWSYFLSLFYFSHQLILLAHVKTRVFFTFCKAFKLRMIYWKVESCLSNKLLNSYT